MYKVAEGCAFTSKGVMYKAGDEVTESVFGSAEALAKQVERGKVVRVQEEGGKSAAGTLGASTGVLETLGKVGASEGARPKRGKKNAEDKAAHSGAGELRIEAGNEGTAEDSVDGAETRAVEDLVADALGNG
jgi:hypothetical protein